MAIMFNKSERAAVETGFGQVEVACENIGWSDSGRIKDALAHETKQRATGGHTRLEAALVAKALMSREFLHGLQDQLSDSLEQVPGVPHVNERHYPRPADLFGLSRGCLEAYLLGAEIGRRKQGNTWDRVKFPDIIAGVVAHSEAHRRALRSL